jgi:hypothetical protein
MTDYKVTARFADGTTQAYDAVPMEVARNVYYGFVRNEDCVEATYRISSGYRDLYCEAGKYNAEDTRRMGGEFPIEKYFDSEKAKANATPLPAGVDCADPMLALTGACTNRTTTELAADCQEDVNKGLPRCQPMTLADGSINCAQPDNAVTTTCWQQSLVMKAAGATTAIDCSLPGYSFYPACTGIKPQAVIEFEKAASGAKPFEPVVALSETSTISNDKNKISGSIDLTSRSSKTTTLRIDLDLAKAKVKVVATKKGSPTLTQTVSADANGNKTVTFKRNLKGYTVKIIVDGETIDSVKI